MKSTITNFVLAVSLVGVLMAAFLVSPRNHAEAGSVGVSPQLSVATTSAATSITTSARILATTTNATNPDGSHVRVYATICTASANPVAINMNADKASNAPGGQITAWIAAAAGYNACFTINDQNMYQGSVTASSTNQTATVVTAQEFVQ